jgi:hypothetical protein
MMGDQPLLPLSNYHVRSKSLRDYECKFRLMFDALALQHLHRDLGVNSTSNRVLPLRLINSSSTAEFPGPSLRFLVRFTTCPSVSGSIYFCAGVEGKAAARVNPRARNGTLTGAAIGAVGAAVGFRTSELLPPLALRSSPAGINRIAGLAEPRRSKMHTWLLSARRALRHKLKRDIISRDALPSRRIPPTPPSPPQGRSICSREIIIYLRARAPPTFYGEAETRARARVARATFRKRELNGSRDEYLSIIRECLVRFEEMARRQDRFVIFSACSI